MSGKGGICIRKLWPLYAAIFIAFVGFSVQLPVFTSMMLDPVQGFLVHWTLSYRKVFLGLFLGLYPLGQFFGSPVLGALSDRLGRKPVLVGSLFLLTLCYIFISLALMFQWKYLLLLLLFLAGYLDGNIAVSQGGITDMAIDRSRYFGYIYICSSSAFIVGPLLSSIFGRFGIAITFWVVTLLTATVTVCVFWFYEETHKKNGKSKDAFTNLLSVFTDQRLRFFYGVNFIVYLAIFGYLRVYPIYIEDLYRVGLVMLSLMIAYVSLPFILMNLIVVPLISKHLHHPQSLAMWFAWLTGIFMISIVIPEHFHALWILLFLTTAALALLMTYSTVTLSLHADQEEQGAVMGNNQSLLSLAQGIAAIFAGSLAALASRLPLILFGLLSLLAGLLLQRKGKTL